MSRTEFHTGRLYPVQLNGTLEESCRAIAKRHKIKLGEDWQEDFMDHFDKYENKKGHVNEEYFIHKENLYRVIDHVESDNEDDFMKLTRNNDGSISFVGQFYNGGTCFSEMLEESLDDLKPSYNDQFRDIIKNILEDGTVTPPATVPSACLLVLQHVGFDKTIELIEGIIKENKDDIYKSSAFEAALDYIKNI